MDTMPTSSFEAAYAELEQIISQLEGSGLALDESVTLYERGRQLSAYCQQLLDAAELRVTQITEGVKSDIVG